MKIRFWVMIGFLLASCASIQSNPTQATPGLSPRIQETRTPASIYTVTSTPKAVPALPTSLSTFPESATLNPMSPIAASFISTEAGWVATKTQLLQTRDGGRTWQVVADISQPLIRLDFIDVENGWAYGHGQILVTHDGGRTWEVQRTDIPENGSSFWKPSIDFVNAKVGWLGEAGQLLKTSDVGKTWQDVSITQGPSIYIRPDYSISFISVDVGFVMQAFVNPPATDLSLLKTSDGGKTWQTVATGGLNAQVDGLPWFRGPDEIFFLDDQHGWFVGGPNVPGWMTTDGGKTWQQLPQSLSQEGGFLGPSQLHMFTPLGGIAILQAPRSSLIRTEDGGKTWYQMLP